MPTPCPAQVFTYVCFVHAEMYEDLKEYLNWYDTRSDVKFAKDAPVIGLVLQRSHLVTGDEGHYSGVVMEMEARGAKVRHTHTHTHTHTHCPTSQQCLQIYTNVCGHGHDILSGGQHESNFPFAVHLDGTLMVLRAPNFAARQKRALR